jgi:CIC family chloride channel protein
MMEYTIIGFTPVILAAVTATAITQIFYGNDPLLIFPSVEMSSLWELPYIVLVGLVVGLAAGLFIHVMKIGLRQLHRPFWLRATLAGLITGLCALAAPQILGIGYDTLNDAVSGNIVLGLLLVIIIAKLLATAFSVGLGLPIGLIGPSLLIGACLGDAMGILGETILPDYATNRSFYVMLGMGAMMGAVLNAPLAALMALLELTQNSNIIFPAMLAITIANITNSELCRQKSAHQTALDFLKQKLRTDPLSLSLQRTSVASIMDRKLSASGQHVNREEAKQLLNQPCNWFLVEKDGGELRLLGSQQLHTALSSALTDQETDSFDLLDLVQNHRMVVELHMQATLREAQDLLDEHNADAVYISGFVASSPYPDSGILTRTDIREYTQTPQ